MYEKYGAIKKNNTYEFRVYAPNANEIVLVINDEEIQMIKDSTDFYIEYPANHMDSYYYMIDGKDKFDPYARYITGGLKKGKRGYESRVYEHSYQFKNQKTNKALDNNLKILEFYMPLTSGENYKEKATEIISKVKSGKYSHVIILPISYNWYPGSLGYQPQGFFSPSWFYGNPDELREMVDTLHGAGISVILDMCWWQTTESNGPDSLMNYDGTDLYAGKEDATRFGGFYMNLNSPYVIEFIKSSFNFWLDEYMFDGLRLDGINEIVFDKTNERNLLTEKINIINYLIEGIEDKVILEFIDKKSPMKFGFATDKDDGSILALLLKAQLELTATDSQPHKDDIMFQEIKQYLFESKSFSSINHDFFITGLSKSKVETFDDFSNIAKSYNVIPFNEDYSKNISFILKILYALRNVIIEFAHIEHYSQSLSDEYEEFKNYVDDVWVDDFVLTETDNGFRVAYAKKEIDFNFAAREVTLL